MQSNADVTKSSDFNENSKERAFKSDLFIGPIYSGCFMSQQSTCVLQYERQRLNGPTGNGDWNDT